MKNEAFTYAWREFTTPQLRKTMYLLLALLFVQQITALVPGYAFGSIINELSQPGNGMKTTWMLVGLFVGSQLLVNVIHLIRERYDLVHHWFKFMEQFQRCSLEKIGAQRLSFFCKKDSSEIICDIQSGFGAVRQTLIQTMWNIVPTITSSIILIIALAVLYPLYGALTVLTGVFIFWITKYTARKMLPKSRWINIRRTTESTRMMEFIRRAPDIALTDASSVRRDLYAFTKKTNEEGFRISWLFEILYNRLSLANIASSSLLLAVGVWDADRGNISMGDLAIIFGWFSSSIARISNLGRSFRTITENQASIGKLKKALEGSNDCLPNGTKKVWLLSSPITFADVHYTYRGGEKPSHALCGVNFTIEQGSFVAFVGKSGAGKSTIFNILLQGITPDSGVVTVGGADLRDVESRGYYSQLVYIPQDKSLLSISLRDNLLLGNERDISDEEIAEVLASLGLEKLILRLHKKLGEGGKKLSGGERQRILIARAMLRTDAHVILLDEPTSDLDVYSEEKVRDALLELRRQGKTIVMIAHRLNTVQHADTIFVMDEGKIVSEGTHQGLLESCGRYAEMVKKSHVA